MWHPICESLLFINRTELQLGCNISTKLFFKIDNLFRRNQKLKTNKLENWMMRNHVKMKAFQAFLSIFWMSFVLVESLFDVLDRCCAKQMECFWIFLFHLQNEKKFNCIIIEIKNIFQKIMQNCLTRSMKNQCAMSKKKSPNCPKMSEK